MSHSNEAHTHKIVACGGRRAMYNLNGRIVTVGSTVLERETRQLERDFTSDNSTWEFERIDTASDSESSSTTSASESRGRTHDRSSRSRKGRGKSDDQKGAASETDTSEST